MGKTAYYLKKIVFRLKEKILSILPILIGSFILLGILSIVTYFIKPYLPGNIREPLEILNNGDWQTKKDAIRTVFDSFGVQKYLIFIILQILQVLLAPIPGQLVGMIGGFLFGFFRGLMVTMIGLTIGSLVAMSIVRFFSNTLIRRFVSPEMIDRFDFLINKGGLLNFFMIFLLPALPDDAVCFIAGLTKLKLWKLVLVCVLGRLPGMAVLTFVGASVGRNILITRIIFICIIILSLMVWIFDKEIREYAYLFTKRV